MNYLYLYNTPGKHNFKIKKINRNTAIANSSFPHLSSLYELTFDSQYKTNLKNNDKVCVYFFPYSTNIKSVDPLFIMLHGFGSKNNRLDNYFNLVSFLIENKFNCMIMHLPYHLSRTPDSEKSGERLIYFNDIQTLEFFHQAVIDVCSLTDLARKEMNTKKIILCGFSLGSMVSSIASAVNKDISKTVLIFGGGNWYEIHWNGMLSYYLKGNCLSGENDNISKKKCSEIYKSFNDFKTEFEKIDIKSKPLNLNLSDNPDLRSKLKKFKFCFLCDPLAFAHMIDRDKILMINSRFDHYFSRSSTLDLWNQLNKPEIYWFNKLHSSKILANPKTKKIILDFISC